MKQRYYFDWAATAPPAGLSPPVPFGNPSSPHTEGRLARRALEDARSRCAAALGVGAETLYFTSGATEANTIVLHSLLARKDPPGTLLYSATEHPSVRENALALKRLGIPARQIQAEKDGRISGERFSSALGRAERPALAAVMAVNNETGSASDIPALASLARKFPGPPPRFHCDIVQAVGKVPVALGEWGVDSASLSAHKLGGPRGIGLLYLRQPAGALGAGGSQEKGIRPGTENVAGAAALAEILEARAGIGIVRAEYAAAAARFGFLIRSLRELDRCALIPEDRQDEDTRFSPYILQAAFSGIPGQAAVRALDDEGFAVSTGSACSSHRESRPVLDAMGVDRETALYGIRISQGWTTTDDDIEALIRAVRKMLAKL
ncbi:MAG: aminotransferase class V-fold PLP-dependent enzyme [Treponema sp.]|jgi:cysteine desulfurase|nr:aminotransferase class V-fold PLP-dependent enzyme [Treponema sp.]